MSDEVTVSTVKSALRAWHILVLVALGAWGASDVYHQSVRTDDKVVELTRSVTVLDNRLTELTQAVRDLKQEISETKHVVR